PLAAALPSERGEGPRGARRPVRTLTPALSRRERESRPLRSALAVHIRLHRLGVFGAGEGLAVGHPHHISENLQAIAVRIEEVKRATTTTAQVTTPLKAVDQWPIDDLDALGMQMRQGLEKCVAILDLKGNLLDQPLTRAGGGHVHALGGGGDHEVVVHVVKPQEGALRTIGPLIAIGDRTPQHLGVELERTLEVGDQKPYVSYALNLDTHIPSSFTVALSPHARSCLPLRERPGTCLGSTRRLLE